MSELRMRGALSGAILVVALMAAGCGRGRTVANAPSATPPGTSPVVNSPPAGPTIVAPDLPPATAAMPFVLELTPLLDAVAASEPLTLTLTLKNGWEERVVIDKRFPQLEFRVYDAHGKLLPGPPVTQIIVRATTCNDQEPLEPGEFITSQVAPPIWKWKLLPGVYGIEATLTVPDEATDCGLNPWMGQIVSRRAAFTVK